MKLITLENGNINSYGDGNIRLCNDNMVKWDDKMRTKGENGVKIKVNLEAQHTPQLKLLHVLMQSIALIVI